LQRCADREWRGAEKGATV